MVLSDKNNLPQVGTPQTEGNLTADSDQVKAPVVGAGLKDFGGGHSHSPMTSSREHARKRLALLEVEEMPTPESLGKNISDIYEVVKVARNIHKEIRDTIGQAVCTMSALRNAGRR